MNYRHLLLVIEADRDPGAAVAALRRAAPRCEKLVVVALGAREPPSLEAFAGAVAEVDLHVVPDPGGLGLAAAASPSVPIVVVQPRARRHVGGARRAPVAERAHRLGLDLRRPRPRRTSSASRAARARSPPSASSSWITPPPATG